MSSLAEETSLLPIPMKAVRFPVELRIPDGFRPEDPATWPEIEGRLEFLGGRLLYLPPCGDAQGAAAASAAHVLLSWAEERADFVVFANEVGIKLGEDVRGADAAIWRRDQLGAPTGGYLTSPPLLAVEVAGAYDTEERLRDKAAWYVERGVPLVWLLLPKPFEVVVLRRGSESRRGRGESLPAAPELPGLEPEVNDLFQQLRDP